MKPLAIKIILLMIPAYYFGFYLSPYSGVETTVPPMVSGLCAGLFIFGCIALIIMWIVNDLHL